MLERDFVIQRDGGDFAVLDMILRMNTISPEWIRSPIMESPSAMSAKSQGKSSSTVTNSVPSPGL